MLSETASKYGTTLILVTHDLHVAEQAERVLTIEDGIIVSDSKGIAASVVKASVAEV